MKKRNLITVLSSASYKRRLRAWRSALAQSASQRAVIAMIGDSITEGHASTNFDTTSFVSLLRSQMIAAYGDGGEGFISPVHTSDPLESGWATSPTRRWTFATGSWTLPDANILNGWGAIGGDAYWTNSTIQPQITISGDTLQVISGVKFNATARNLQTYVDTVLQETWDLAGGAADQSQFAPGTVHTFSSLGAGSHAIKFSTTATYPFLEGIRVLNGTTGIVIDRYAKSGLQAAWLGTVNDSDPSGTNYNNFFKTLYSTCDLFPASLYIIMLGTNDYVGQVSLATFKTALTTIVRRCKAHGSVILLTPPAPNSSLTIPMASYAQKVREVAAENSSLCIDIFTRWGSAYKAAMMADTNHPNNDGHTDIANAIYPFIKL